MTELDLTNALWDIQETLSEYIRNGQKQSWNSNYEGSIDRAQKSLKQVKAIGEAVPDVVRLIVRDDCPLDVLVDLPDETLEAIELLHKITGDGK